MSKIEREMFKAEQATDEKLHALARKENSVFKVIIIVAGTFAAGFIVASIVAGVA